METHVAAKVIIVHPDNDKILLIKRSMSQDVGYEPAGGRVDIDFKQRQAENLETCLAREAREELGVELVEPRYFGSYYFFWKVRPNACTICAVYVARALDLGSIKRVGHENGGSVYPLWVEVDAILQGEVFVASHHVGFADMLLRLARELRVPEKIK